MHKSTLYLRTGKHPEDLRRLFEPNDSIILSPTGADTISRSSRMVTVPQPILDDLSSPHHINIHDVEPQRSDVTKSVPKTTWLRALHWAISKPSRHMMRLSRYDVRMQSFYSYTMTDYFPYAPCGVATRNAQPTFATPIVCSSLSF